MYARLLAAALSPAVLALPACAQKPVPPGGSDSTALHALHHPATNDSAFAALQQRGEAAMGVDQYASQHRFETLPDGGRIALQQPGGDSAAVQIIRAHMQDIARSFGRGDFTTPMFVHNTAKVPGTAVLASKRNVIRYAYRPLPDGAELRIYTTDADALKAIQEFMAFQRSDHRTSP
jgi:hypothetical protein